MDDTTVTMQETLFNVTNRTAVHTTSLSFEPTTRLESPTGYMCYDILRRLKMEPLSSEIFQAYIRLGNPIKAPPMSSLAHGAQIEL